MNTTLKLLTKILERKIRNKINMAEEQQSFRKNRTALPQHSYKTSSTEIDRTTNWCIYTILT